MASTKFDPVAWRADGAGYFLSLAAWEVTAIPFSFQSVGVAFAAIDPASVAALGAALDLAAREGGE